MRLKSVSHVLAWTSLMGVLSLPAMTGAAWAAPVLDGSNLGAPTATVTYVPGAPESNFGAPTNTTDGAAYNIYLGSDANYVYAEVQQNGTGGTSAGAFANLYFGVGSTASSSSTYGIEVSNNRSFVPGGSGYYDIASTGIVTSIRDNGATIEVAIPFSYFETDPQGLGFPLLSAANPNLELRLSQSFGYSVAGGSIYGPNRLGMVTDPHFTTTVPEPASLSVLGLGLVGLGASHLRRRARA